MTKYFYFTLLLLSMAFTSFAQVTCNTVLMDQFNPSEFVNDVWGYTDANGNEYAIMGTSTRVYFFDITDPYNIVEIDNFQGGGSSIWRDFKTYDTYAYAVTEDDSEGMMIFDLSNLPNSVTMVSQTSAFFGSSHNIFIDTDNARLYTAGSDTQGSGTTILDLSDPVNPVVLGSYNLSNLPGGPNNGYIHDIYVHDNIAYASHGYRGFYIWDFNDVNNPFLVAGMDATSGYNHSSWITDDGNYAFYAEEIPAGQPLAVVDLQGINWGSNYIVNNDNIDVVATFKDPILAPAHLDVIPHNPFVKGNYLYVSHYEDGVMIWDISDPLNPVKFAYYDTYPSNNSYNGYNGCWGVYPFYDSGTIVASDDAGGLYVFKIAEVVLALELSNFGATLNDDVVDIKWNTISEPEGAVFEVEKSLDGVQFKTISELTGKSAGNNSYAAMDNEPAGGNNYYRLKQITTDGSISYSNVHMVYYSKTDVQIYPTLIQEGNINVRFLNAEIPFGSISIYNTKGEQVAYQDVENIEAGMNVEFPTADLSNGIYFVFYSDGLMEFSEKITIAK